MRESAVDTPLVIISRFNLAYNPQLCLNRAWLEARLELLERYTLPSLKAQKDGGFVWLLLVHPDIPEIYLQRLENHRKELPQLIVVRTWRDLAQKELVRRLFPDDEWVITSRLDTDDAVADDFTRIIRRRLNRGGFAFLNMDNGFVLDRENRKLYRRLYLYNPFIAVREKIDGMRGVYRYSHCHIHFCGPVRHFRGMPRWLQVVHGGNWMNMARGLPASARMLSAHFSHLGGGEPGGLAADKFTMPFRSRAKYRVELLKMMVMAWLGRLTRLRRFGGADRYAEYLTRAGKISRGR